MGPAENIITPTAGITAVTMIVISSATPTTVITESSNKTNGVTPRRWLILANPPLAATITEVIGDG
jgi:glucan phosphorylase